MITYGKFDRSTCYWARYLTLSGEYKLLHVTRSEVKFFASRLGLGEVISDKIVGDYFIYIIKHLADSATYSKKIAKLKPVRLARVKKPNFGALNRDA